MSERFGVGDYVNIRSKTDPMPDEPGVVVGYVVRVPGHTPLIAAKDELRHAAFADVDRTGLNKLSHELIETAEHSIKKMISEAIDEGIAMVRAEFEKKLAALTGRLDNVGAINHENRAVMQTLKELLPPK